MKKNNVVIAKRKTTIASAVATEGEGKVTINNRGIAAYNDNLFRLIVSEPLELSDGLYKKYDISVTVNGGGNTSRAQAIRSVIAKALVKKEKSLRKVFLEYDRAMLVDDKRQTEPQKPYTRPTRISSGQPAGSK